MSEIVDLLKRLLAFASTAAAVVGPPPSATGGSAE